MPHSFETVLLVEDDPGQAIMVELLLQDYGFPAVLAAAEAETAFEMLHRHPIDLLICDLNLPGKDGVSLLRYVSRLQSPPAVIVLSSVERSLLDTVGHLAIEMGVNLLGVTSKPLRTEILDSFLKRTPKVDDPSRLQRPPAPSVIVSDSLLLQALEQRWFEPFYEARINRDTGNIEGVEILARMRVPGHGVVRPAEFIDRLEAISRIADMTWQVAEQGLRFVQQCRQRDLPLTISLNLSPMMLTDDSLIDHLSGLASRYGFGPQEITLEITESAAIDSGIDALERLVQIRLRGFGLSIDDFGTGFSSLSQLSKVPFTEMKIDRSFTHGALTDPKSRAVVESSIDLARRLGLKICAEGIETHDVFRLIHDLHVDALQGYFFHRPMPGSELEPWARDWNQRTTIDSLYGAPAP